MRVSVIIPIYNMGAYLEECLESVFSQTLKEIEVICINDGSTDNSEEILQKYAYKNSNLKIISQNNMGVASSRNIGINLAKGEFVAFMDPDDFYLEKDTLECLYVNASENNVNICGGSFSGYRNGVVITQYYGMRKKYTFQNDKIVEYDKYQFPYGFTRFIYKLKFLKDNKLYFPLYTYYEDPLFFVRAMICAKEFYALKKVTYTYRVGHKKLVLNREKTLDHAKSAIEILKISKKLGMKDLHKTVVDVLKDYLSASIYKLLMKDDFEFETIISQINENIDSNLLNLYSLDERNLFLLNYNQLKKYMNDVTKKEMEFKKSIEGYKNVIIYGIGRIGINVAEYLKKIKNIKIVNFAVSDKSENPKFVDNISVKEIDELLKYKNDTLIIIATLEYLQSEIEFKLKELDFKNILKINSEEFQLFNGYL